MNTEKLLQLIDNPNAVSKKQTVVLETVLEEFPYFQTARVLHLKGLKNQHSFKYNKALKKTAAYTTNRTVLFDFITANTLDFVAISKNEKNILNDIEVIDSKIIDHLHKSIIASENNKDILSELKQFDNLSIFDKVEKLPVNKNLNLEITTEKKEENNKILELGNPINFKRTDSYSFNEWLQLDTKEPIKRNKKESLSEKSQINKDLLDEIDLDKTKNYLTKNELIKQFIKNKPKIKPIKNQEVKNVFIDETKENTSLMTETLARVYLEQKKYKKAIASFKILSLKYPEKSSFFADRIKAINFLENNKS